MLHLLLTCPAWTRIGRRRLAAHHAFRTTLNTVDLKRTITELIQVPREVVDGDHLLEPRFPRFMNDGAQPARVVRPDLMDLGEFRAFCLTLPGVSHDYPSMRPVGHARGRFGVPKSSHHGHLPLREHEPEVQVLNAH